MQGLWNVAFGVKELNRGCGNSLIAVEGEFKHTLHVPVVQADVLRLAAHFRSSIWAVVVHQS